jgi:hypothetical protein
MFFWLKLFDVKAKQRTWAMDEIVEHFPSKCKALSSIHGRAKNKTKCEKQEGM